MTLSSDLTVSRDAALVLETQYAALNLNYSSLVDQYDALWDEKQALEESIAPRPVIGGLMRRNAALTGAPVDPNLPPNLEPGWDTLQPAPGALVTAQIESWLATGKPFALRPMLGKYAPAWIKALAGTFSYTEPNSGQVTPDMLRWWEPVAVLATADLYYRLAVEFDGDLQFIWADGGMTVYPEPMQRGLGSDATRASLGAAGFTTAKDMDALNAGIQAVAGFKRTQVGMHFNPYQRLATNGTWTTDPTKTQTLMQHFVDGVANPVLSNCSLRSSYLSNMQTANGGVYAQILSFPQAKRQLQTAQWSLVGDLRACIDWCVQNGFHALELPTGHDLSATEINAYNAQLQNNGGEV